MESFWTAMEGMEWFGWRGAWPLEGFSTKDWRLQLQEWVDYYHYLISIGDPRVEKWPLMDSPVITIIITVLYLLLCAYGPRLMSRYEPLDLRLPIVVYNLACAGLNLYIGLEILTTSTYMTYSWMCEPVDYSNNPLAVRIAAALWWYYASKLFELFDSVFIILRKRNGQLSFLHVYHHATMFCLWWIGAKYVAGGSSFLGAMFNCGVHVLMYTYYALAAFGGSVRKYLWWKKYLTIIQILQFVFALIMGLNAIRIGCDFPMWMQYSLVCYMVSFIVLFSNFYYKAYTSSPKSLSKTNGTQHEETNGHQNGSIKKLE